MNSIYKEYPGQKYNIVWDKRGATFVRDNKPQTRNPNISEVVFGSWNRIYLKKTNRPRSVTVTTVKPFGLV